jgi:cell division protein FtsL
MKTLTIVAGMMLVFVFVWERVDVVRLGYQIERLKIQKVLLERERDQLQVKFSALTAPERIAKVATEKLGLVPPQQGQVLMVHQPGKASSPSLPPVEQVRLARHISTGRASE